MGLSDIFRKKQDRRQEIILSNTTDSKTVVRKTKELIDDCEICNFMQDKEKRHIVSCPNDPHAWCLKSRLLAIEGKIYYTSLCYYYCTGGEMNNFLCDFNWLKSHSPAELYNHLQLISSDQDPFTKEEFVEALNSINYNPYYDSEKMELCLYSHNLSDQPKQEVSIIRDKSDYFIGITLGDTTQIVRLESGFIKGTSVFLYDIFDLMNQKYGFFIYYNKEGFPSNFPGNPYVNLDTFTVEKSNS